MGKAILWYIKSLRECMNVIHRVAKRFSKIWLYYRIFYRSRFRFTKIDYRFRNCTSYYKFARGNEKYRPQSDIIYVSSNLRRVRDHTAHSVWPLRHRPPDDHPHHRPPWQSAAWVVVRGRSCDATSFKAVDRLSVRLSMWASENNKWWK